MVLFIGTVRSAVSFLRLETVREDPNVRKEIKQVRSISLFGISAIVSTWALFNLSWNIVLGELAALLFLHWLVMLFLGISKTSLGKKIEQAKKSRGIAIHSIFLAILTLYLAYDAIVAPGVEFRRGAVLMLLLCWFACHLVAKTLAKPQQEIPAP